MSEKSETNAAIAPQLDMSSILKDVTDFAGVKAAIINEIKKIKSQGTTRIGFVSGPIGSTSQFVDDETGTAMEKSMCEMEKVTHEMIVEYNIPIFSSTDIFRVSWDQLTETKQIQQGILIGKKKEAAMNNLFGGILEESGITDIFMMKGYEKAPGCRHELGVAKNLKIKDHYL